MRTSVRASPRARMAVVLAEGVSPSGHGSTMAPTLRTTSLLRATGERGWPVTAMSGWAVSGRARSMVSRTSRVLPLLENVTNTSFCASRPRSPCAASPGWRKQAGVPVEDNVVAIFMAMMPTLPMPLSTTLPVQASSRSTARTKSRVSRIERIASASAWRMACARSSSSCAAAGEGSARTRRLAVGRFGMRSASRLRVGSRTETDGAAGPG